MLQISYVFYSTGIIMKKLVLAIVLALTSLFNVLAQAANDSSTINVNIALTSKCLFSSVVPVAISYTSFQTTAATSTGGTFNMKCTNTLGYKVGFSAATTPAPTDAVTDSVLNLPYTLSISAATGTGTGNDQGYTVTGTIAQGLAGTCSGPSCNNSAATNNVRTVYVVY